jgi:hypothetical protein
MFGRISFTRLCRYNKHKTVNNDCCMCSIGTMHIHYASLFLLTDFLFAQALFRLGSAEGCGEFMMNGKGSGSRKFRSPSRYYHGTFLRNGGNILVYTRKKRQENLPNVRVKIDIYM